MDKLEAVRLLRILADLIESDLVRVADIKDLPVDDVLELAAAEADKNVRDAGDLKDLGHE